MLQESNIERFYVGRKEWVPKMEPTELFRRNYYMIILSVGQSALYYPNRRILLDGTYLIVTNPRLPFGTEIIDENHSGYVCLFPEDFISQVAYSRSVLRSPLFNLACPPVVKLSEQKAERIKQIFEEMILLDESDYIFKEERQLVYIQQIIHEILQIPSSESLTLPNSSSYRIVMRFYDLMEEQFPVNTQTMPLRLKTPQDFADALFIHRNSLNRAVKEVVGQPVSAIITDRIVAEARSLLRFSDWNVVDIAHMLGFSSTSYFCMVFKKIAGMSPMAFRNLWEKK